MTTLGAAPEQACPAKQECFSWPATGSLGEPFTSQRSVWKHAWFCPWIDADAGTVRTPFGPNAGLSNRACTLPPASIFTSHTETRALTALAGAAWNPVPMLPHVSNDVIFAVPFPKPPVCTPVQPAPAKNAAQTRAVADAAWADGTKKRAERPYSAP